MQMHDIAAIAAALVTRATVKSTLDDNPALSSAPAVFWRRRKSQRVWIGRSLPTVPTAARDVTAPTSPRRRIRLSTPPESGVFKVVARQRDGSAPPPAGTC